MGHLSPPASPVLRCVEPELQLGGAAGFCWSLPSRLPDPPVLPQGRGADEPCTRDAASSRPCRAALEGREHVRLLPGGGQTGGCLLLLFPFPSFSHLHSPKESGHPEGSGTRAGGLPTLLHSPWTGLETDSVWSLLSRVPSTEGPSQTPSSTSARFLRWG